MPQKLNAVRFMRRLGRRRSRVISSQPVHWAFDAQCASAHHVKKSSWRSRRDGRAAPGWCRFFALWPWRTTTSPRSRCRSFTRSHSTPCKRDNNCDTSLRESTTDRRAWFCVEADMPAEAIDVRKRYTSHGASARGSRWPTNAANRELSLSGSAGWRRRRIRDPGAPGRGPRDRLEWLPWRSSRAAPAHRPARAASPAGPRA